MAITDLTNTTWEFNDTLSFTPAENIGVNFSINFTNDAGHSYTYIRLGLDSFDGDNFFHSVKYETKIAYGSGAFGGWPDLFDKIITITGGTDATNPQLISWLEANGTLQGGSEPVTIKAGTYTWNETIPQSGWCSGTTVKGARFNFKVANGAYKKYGFYYTNIDEDTITTSWQLADTDWTINKYMGYDFPQNRWVYDARTFTVETDQEVTGDDPQGFMDYLTANSDYGSQSEPEQTDTKPIYKRVNGAWIKLTAFERVNGAWVKISSAVETEEPEQPQEPKNCLTFSSPSTFTIGVVNNLKYWDGTLEYSTDGSTWTTWAGTSAISSASDGTKHNLYLRGTGNTYITGSSANASKARWVLTGSNISCSGNIETLLDYATVANGEHPTMANYCYYYMFNGYKSLVTAPELPTTTLANNCYSNMFQNCTSLVTAPELPATTLANNCYYYMFYGCTSLATAPTLPATTMTNYCYNSMFNGCTSLTTAPKLPATSLQTGCYRYMFNNCKNLTAIPELPAKKLMSACYQSMFQGCTQIKLSTTQTGDYQTAYRIPTSGTGTTESTNVMLTMFTSTGGTFTGEPSINTTYYTSNTVV